MTKGSYQCYFFSDARWITKILSSVGYLINFIAPYYWDFNHRKIKSEQKSIMPWNYQAPSKRPFSVRVNRHCHQTINDLGFVGPISSVNSAPFLLSPSSPLVQYFKNSLKIWTVLSSTTLQKRGPRSASAQGPYFSNSHSRVGVSKWHSRNQILPAAWLYK